MIHDFTVSIYECDIPDALYDRLIDAIDDVLTVWFEHTDTPPIWDFSSVLHRKDFS